MSNVIVSRPASVPVDQVGADVGTRRPSKPLLAQRFYTAMRACDQRHGAKPIEGEDTYRGVLASCRGNLKIYRQTLKKSNNNDAAVLLGKGLPDNRGRFAG
ncbi:MAG TPA: hypothetical protein VLH40_00830, partial [Atribacteraceae bacterium]|nr:hypothetical protein [Atribacteraceae bacterium]